MKTIPLVLGCLLFSATSALAEDCSRWSAGLQPDEGGDVMMASVCADGRPDDLLIITCGGEGKLGLRLVPSVADGFPPGDDMEYHSAFSFSDGTASADIDLRFEAMDAVMAARPNRDSDLVRLLKAKGPLTVTDLAGVLPTYTFPLAGSTKAIGKVERACYN